MIDPDATALDDAFLHIVRDWSRGGAGCDARRFDELALATCAHQLERNSAYRRFAASLGVDTRRPPATWRDIPAVPSAAFKEAALATFDVRRAELEFHTSGTTDTRAGKHFVEHARLYDASLLAGFDRFVLGDRARLRYLNLVPNPRYNRRSSLGYMLGHVSVLRGDGKAAYFLDENAVDVDGFTHALRGAVAQGQPVCVAGTAFALATLLDELEARRHRFEAPAGSRIMETGGFKGRARVVERVELYARLEATLGIAQASIVAEYGMTELLSQYYDDAPSRATERRVKVAPPWLRTLVVDGAGNAVADGATGFLRHVDLGNRSSVIAIDTEDRGYLVPEGLVLLGRAVDAPLRGCSLDAEELAPAAPVLR